MMADMASMEFLPSALSAFLARHPGVSIDVKERTGREIQPAVRDGAADVGILAAGTPTAGLKGQTYRQDRLVVVAPYRHPLAKRESIRFDETLPFEYVELLEQRAYKGSGTKRGTRKSPKVRVQVGHFGDMCRMIASNFGIGIMPESVACRYSEELKIAIIPLLDDWADQSSFICYRSLGPLPAFAKELIELLLENAAHEGSDLAVPVLS
jgi:DNA-binding transcriptional LysR family regulator